MASCYRISQMLDVAKFYLSMYNGRERSPMGPTYRLILKILLEAFTRSLHWCRFILGHARRNGSFSFFTLH